MTYAIKPRQNFPYTLKRDKGKKDAHVPTFHLRPLTAAEYAKLEDRDMKIVPDEEGNVVEYDAQGGTNTLLVLRAGLIGWEGFFFSEKEEANFDLRGVKLQVLGSTRDCVTDECIEMLSPEDRQEIAAAIRMGCAPSESERKN